MLCLREKLVGWSVSASFPLTLHCCNFSEDSVKLLLLDAEKTNVPNVVLCKICLQVAGDLSV